MIYKEIIVRYVSHIVGAIKVALFTLVFASAGFGADSVQNTAKASYSVGSVSAVSNSNTVSEIICTASTLEYLKYAPLSAAAEMVNVPITKYMNSPGSYISMQNPVPVGSTSPLDLSNPIPLIKADVYHEGEPLFLRLTDRDQNVDTAVAETIILTLESGGNGEKETLVLTETGQDTGVFLGYVQSTKGAAIKENGFFSVYENCQILAKYEDKCGPNGTGINTVVAATALVDPFGVVFDTSNGQPVNGATVTLVNVNTGSPAIVYGDDGVSTYPSTVTTGGTASDSSGVVYTFSPGGYRFPFIAPGKYRLDVVTPPAYRVPSAVSTADILSLGPFAIVNPGSRGEEFYINPGPAIHIDIPADPIRTWLYLTKAASKSSASIGDLLQYRITVENTSDIAIDSILVTDKLPLGFRYRKGSTKINGGRFVDPSISTDGRLLTFSLGTLASRKTADITYVVEIAAGAKIGKAINQATAAGSGGTVSNSAKAEVLVREDLLGSSAIVMGRVFPNGCEDGQDMDGVAGVRIYLEDGTYVVTDKKGMYHFEGLKAGTHVVQLDLETIPEYYELISCEDNNRFAGSPYSQFADLQGGTMWRADFYLSPKPKVEEPKEFVEIRGDVEIELNSILSEREGENTPSTSKIVKYEVPIRAGEVPLRNLRLSIMLPDGVTYIKESSRLGDNPLEEPSVMENVVTFRIEDVDANWNGRVRFSAEIPSNGLQGEFVTQAILTFDTQGASSRRTPMVDNVLGRIEETEKVSLPPAILHPHFISGSAVLSDEDKVQLDGIVNELKDFTIYSMSVTGHTDTQRIGKRLKKTYADNYELSYARARSVAEYLAQFLKLSPSQVTIDGKGPDEPVASNENSEGMAQNRRVELRISAEKGSTWYQLKNLKDRSGIGSVEVKENIEVDTKGPISQHINVSKNMPEFDGAWLKGAKPGLEWAWPYDGYYPPIPSVKIAVKHDPTKKIRVFMNGEEVDPIYLDGTKKRNDNQVAVSLWAGVHIKDGDNLFEAIEYSQDGSEEKRIGRTIHYSGPPVKAELVPEKSRLITDGKTPSVVAVRLTDKDGHPARQGVVGEYNIDPPYMPLQKIADLQNDPLTISKSEKLKYTTGEEGITLIELQPTSKTGEAVVRFNLVNGEKEVRTWLTPGERDWILVGLAEGTAGYNTVSGNMESLGSTGVDDGYYKDGRLAFFAKGMIKGKWLLTMAYDSDKNGNMRGNDSLHQMIDPNRYYTLYGDATQQGYEAASARSLYVKLERDNFYALFGDFETGLNVTELSRYSRNLNGLKSEMKGERFDFKVFASDTNQAFVKDEIRGGGTSGLYRLSRKNIVMNSESIVIETRNRFRSEVLISSQSLSRYIDYSIDYETGSIYFKSPVFSRDENFNPIYIVVNYESFDMSDMSYNYGGRGAVRLMDNRLEVGATHIHEGSVGGEGNLEGIDATVKITDKTTVRTELATTSTDMNGSGSAYIAELFRKSEKLAGKVYVREQDGKFGLGQQRGSETGTRKLGYDGTYLIDERFSLRSEAFRQYNIAVDSVRDMAAVQIQYNEKTYELHAGLRHAEDTLGNGDANRSEQITTGGSFRLMDNRLTLRLEHDQSMLRNNTNSDFPTRTTMGADYKLNDTATLFVAEEFTQGESEDTETTRIGLKASPWSGAQISTSMEQQYSENGTRVFAVTGLKQSYKINAKWSVDAGLERSETLKHPGNSQFNTNVPASSGGSDFTAISGGAAYKEEKWSWTGRVETRNSDSEDKVGLFTGAYGEFKEGIGLAAALQAFRTKYLSGVEKESGDLRFGIAYRPKETKWIVLDRLEFLVDKQNGTSFNYNNWRIINNMNANYKADSRTQVSLQYGSKYVNETIDDKDYSGYTDLTGLEGRYDITKKWDIGLRGNILHSWDADQYKYGYGPSVGYSFVKNVWLSVGYNIAGFRDRDFSRADFTSEGPFVKFRMKFDQGTAKDAVKWFSGQ